MCTFDVLVLKKSAPQNATVMVCVPKGQVKLVNVILVGCPVTAVYQHVLFHAMMARVMWRLGSATVLMDLQVHRSLWFGGNINFYKLLINVVK